MRFTRPLPILLTMTRCLPLCVALFVALIASACAFTPVAYLSVKKSSFVPPAVPSMNRSPNPWLLRMATEGEEEAKQVVSKDGTFYDDEVGIRYWNDAVIYHSPTGLLRIHCDSRLAYL